MIIGQRFSPSLPRRTNGVAATEFWRGTAAEDVEFATLEWVAWYNGSRLLEPLGYVPPAEFEKAYP